MLKRVGVLLVAGAFALTSCANEKFVGRPNLEIVPNGAMPEPFVADLGVATASYVIGPSDKISVFRDGMDERPIEILVDPSGYISVPLAGSVRAAGLTSTQLVALIEEKMKANYVLHPRVAVNVVEITSQSVTVDGQVSKPGLYPIGSKTTLVRTIARAEGVTEFARDDYVVVFRTVGSKQYAALYDLRAIREGAYPDPEIYANDVVTVGESRARRIFKDVLASSALITTPFVALIR